LRANGDWRARKSFLRSERNFEIRLAVAPLRARSLLTSSRAARNRQSPPDKLDEVADAVRNRFVVEVVCGIVQLLGSFTVTDIGKATRYDVEKSCKILRSRKRIAVGTCVFGPEDGDSCG
jgi:hypothetical protein